MSGVRAAPKAAMNAVNALATVNSRAATQASSPNTMSTTRIGVAEMAS